jgi:hypothetical protein
MSEAIGQPGQAALPRPLGIGEILSTDIVHRQACAAPLRTRPLSR